MSMPTSSAPAPGGTAPFLHLALVHVRFQVLEVLRIPIALIGSLAFPPLISLFFIVPNVGDDPVASAIATGSILTFASMIALLFGLGVGISEDRALPWDGYVRVLPAGAGPRFAGRLVTNFAMVATAVTIVFVMNSVLTAFSPTLVEALTGLFAILAGGVVFALLGIAIGYRFTSKAALPLAQLIFFPIAYAGGLLFPPDMLPGPVELISPYLPTRGAAELTWWAFSDHTPDAVALAALVGWAVVLGVLAVLAYRRDEGRRFS